MEKTLVFLVERRAVSFAFLSRADIIYNVWGTSSQFEIITVCQRALKAVDYKEKESETLLNILKIPSS